MTISSWWKKNYARNIEIANTAVRQCPVVQFRRPLPDQRGWDTATAAAADSHPAVRRAVCSGVHPGMIISNVRPAGGRAAIDMRRRRTAADGNPSRLGSTCRRPGHQPSFLRTKSLPPIVHLTSQPAHLPDGGDKLARTRVNSAAASAAHADEDRCRIIAHRPWFHTARYALYRRSKRKYTSLFRHNIAVRTLK